MTRRTIHKTFSLPDSDLIVLLVFDPNGQLHFQTTLLTDTNLITVCFPVRDFLGNFCLHDRKLLDFVASFLGGRLSATELVSVLKTTPEVFTFSCDLLELLDEHIAFRIKNYLYNGPTKELVPNHLH